MVESSGWVAYIRALVTCTIISTSKNWTVVPWTTLRTLSIAHFRNRLHEDYRLANPLVPLPLEDDFPEFLGVPEHRVCKVLCRLKPAKACGPDAVLNWLLKEYVEFLAYPFTRILNSSFKEQLLPSVWKFADVTPIPKKKPAKDLKNDLRPISLPPCISKIANEFVVCDYVKPAALQVLDNNQSGAVPRSSTTLALLEMVHTWTEATDGNCFIHLFSVTHPTNGRNENTNK